MNAQDSNVAPIPPPAFPPPPSAPPPAVAGPMVSVYANTPKARLQLQGPSLWRDVCSAPCNVNVDPAGVYRIGGGSILPSDSFNMPRPSGRVIIDVSYGSPIKRWVGLAMIIGGMVSCLVGGLYIGLADEISQRDASGNPADFYKATGIVAIVHGVIVAGVGIPLSLSSTSVQVR